MPLVGTITKAKIIDVNDLLFYQKKRDGKISILLNKGDWKEIFPSDKEFKSRSDK